MKKSELFNIHDLKRENLFYKENYAHINAKNKELKNENDKLKEELRLLRSEKVFYENYSSRLEYIFRLKSSVDLYRRDSKSS